MLNTFAVVTENPEDIAGILHQRYGGLVDTWQCTFMSPNDETTRKVIQAVQAG